MSRFGMGFGKDNPKDLGVRPGVRIHSAKCQEMKNRWFTDTETAEGGRPEWFQSKHKPERRIGGPDGGEWQLVWHPRSRMDSPTMPTRKVLTTLKDDEEKEKLKLALSKGLAAMQASKGRGNQATSRSEPMVPMADTDELRAMSRGSRRLGTAGSQRGGEGGAGGDENRPPPSRGSRPGTSGSARSVRSNRSGRTGRSFFTSSSMATTNAKELLDRIAGLETALKKEQTLRQKMQSVLALETWAE